ncbi:hypothetical protein J7L27_01800 [Candidatus Bathyarchaeota archaeon]|nr:hypothetical protein [Candidatus Bathyarchaeota archaeon]
MEMRCRNRCGVSPIISILILLATTIATFSIAYGIYSGWIDIQRNTSFMQMRERLAVEAIWFRSENNVSLYISNVGKVDLTISSIIINGREVDITLNRSYIAPGEGDWVNASYPSGFVNGETYHFVIITKRGTVYETYEKCEGI